MDGIMYSSSGEYYVAQALVSARSSLRHNPIPHVLFASPPPEAAGEDDGLSIKPFEPSNNPFVDKIANMRRSPFERTIFLDSDTFVVGQIAHVLRLLDRYDLAAALAPGLRGGPDPEVPTAFYEFNTGVVAWRASERTAAFMADWGGTYVAWQHEKPFPGAAERRGRADQPAFRRCAWEHHMRIMVLGPEYNYRTRFPGAVVGRVLVIHGRHGDYERVAAQLNESSGPRSFPALPTDRLPEKLRRP
jgi:hypothetical protein